MSKARINSSHGRHTSPKASAPMKPQKVQLRSGFQAATDLNTSGTRRPIPHDATTSPAKTGSDIKLRLSGLSTPRRGKRMY